MPTDPTSISRRRYLTAAGLAGVAGLAGCSLSPPGASDDGQSGDGAGGDQSGDGQSSDGQAGDGATPSAGPVLGYDVALDHSGEPASEWTAPSSSPLETDLTTEVLVENLEIPWDLSFAPDGTLFITERVGNVLTFDGGEVRRVARPAEAIDAGSLEPGSDESSWWVKGGEGGTLGVAAHPTYPEPPLVYVYYTYKTGDGRQNKVAAFDVSASRPGQNFETIVDGIPANKYHNGGRITFGPENYLWITCGDGGQPEGAQDLSSLGGKILRVLPDGQPAPTNPDLGGDDRIFTYGHRNPQGVVWLPDWTPVASEHGPGGRDEINRLEAGANYGWPDVRQRKAYLGADVHRPLVNSGPPPSWAPTGSLFYTGDAVPSLRNRILTGGLISQQVIATTLTPPGGQLPPVGGGIRFDQRWTDDAYTATTHFLFEDELGRVRHLEQGPEGEIYVITSNRDGRAEGPFPTERDDILGRIVPA